MTINPALLQLKDIHLPHSMWPNVQEWVIFSILFAVFFSLGLYYWHRRRHRALYYALRQLTMLRSLLLDNPNNINIAAELSILLRRAALHYFKRENIAGLTGTAWLRFLNDSGHTTHFTDDCGKLLIETPYQKHHHAALSPLMQLTEDWLKTVAKQNRKRK